MTRLFQVYRVLAYVVGVLLIILTTGFVLKLANDDGTVWHDRGDHIASVVGLIHGWLYVIYVILAFIIATRARWSWAFTILMLAAGLIPLLIFWVERRVEHRMREEHPEIFASA